MKKHKYEEELKPVICILIRDLSPGGAQKQSIILANLLARNHNVTLMVQHGYNINYQFYNMIDQSGVKLILLKGNFLRRLYYCTRYFNVNKVNIVFSYLTSDNLIASLSRLFNLKLKVIGGIRNCTIKPGKCFILVILHRLFQNRTIFNSYSGYKNFIKRGFKENKSYIIHNTIENLIPPIGRKKKKLNIIISVGRFVKQKDYHTALESIRILYEKVKTTSHEFKYIIIGYGKFKSKIERLIKRYNMGNIVEIVIKPENINDYYKKADIYLSTSLFEGLSNTILEAMNYSLPVVATNVGDNKELVIHEKTGFLCSPDQPSTIANYLNILLQDADLRLHYGTEGNNLVWNKFSNEVFLSCYNKIIQELIK